LNKYNNKNNKNICNYKPKSECEKKAIKKIIEYQDKYNYCECFQNNIRITGPTGPIGLIGPTGSTEQYICNYLRIYYAYNTSHHYLKVL